MVKSRSPRRKSPRRKSPRRKSPRRKSPRRKSPRRRSPRRKSPRRRSPRRKKSPQGRSNSKSSRMKRGLPKDEKEYILPEMRELATPAQIRNVRAEWGGEPRVPIPPRSDKNIFVFCHGNPVEARLGRLKDNVDLYFSIPHGYSAPAGESQLDFDITHYHPDSNDHDYILSFDDAGADNLIGPYGIGDTYNEHGDYQEVLDALLRQEDDWYQGQYNRLNYGVYDFVSMTVKPQRLDVPTEIKLSELIQMLKYIYGTHHLNIYCDFCRGDKWWWEIPGYSDNRNFRIGPFGMRFHPVKDDIMDWNVDDEEL